VEFSGYFAGMAPKQVTGSKRKQTQASSSQPRRQNPPVQFDTNKFLSPFHQERCQELESRTTWHDKVFSINPEGKYNRIAGIFS